MRIELAYDIVSPYSFLALEVLLRYRPRWQATLDLHPVLLGGLFQASENRSPLMVPARAEYAAVDIVRQARFYRVPLEIPDGFPGNSLVVMRVLTAASDRPELLFRLSIELFRGYFGKRLVIDDPASIKEALGRAGASSSESDALLGATQDPAIKQRLREATERIAKRGAFGAPAIFATDRTGAEQFFFGSDRFETLAHLLDVPYAGPNPDGAAR
jgi:glutathione S-transferase kappa 1